MQREPRGAQDIEGGFDIDFERAEVARNPHTDWRNPGFLPGPDHPVLLVRWREAEAFCQWLSAKEGRTYRPPTEAEWEYAARAGTKTPWWTGADPTALATAGNTADAALRSKVRRAKWAAARGEGHAFLAPVASLKPNGSGLSTRQSLVRLIVMPLAPRGGALAIRDPDGSIVW